jgi:hypothetical protein
MKKCNIIENVGNMPNSWRFACGFRQNAHPLIALLLRISNIGFFYDVLPYDTFVFVC